MRFCVTFLLTAGSAFGWGCEGHQMVAMIARAHLTPETSAAVDQLLSQNPVDPALKRFCQDRPADPMADAATWPDDVRPIAKTGAWHFVDIPLGITKRTPLTEWCAPIVPPPAGQDWPGCVTNAIEYNLAILRDKTKPNSDRATALRYIIHFLGDTHQPLHDSDNDDKGGNCTAMTFFTEEKPANLHSIWDYKLIAHELILSRHTPAAYAYDIDRKYSAQGVKWREAPSDPIEWAWEAHAVAIAKTYGDLSPKIPLEKTNPLPDCDAERGKVAALHISIGDKYFGETLPTIEEQIAKAGNRLAALLNRTIQP